MALHDALFEIIDPDELEEKKIHRLYDVLTEEVSIVDRGANKRRFLLVKREGKMAIPKATKATIVARLQEAVERMLSLRNAFRQAKTTTERLEYPIPTILGREVRAVGTLLQNVAALRKAIVSFPGMSEERKQEIVLPGPVREKAVTTLSEAIERAISVINTVREMEEGPGEVPPEVGKEVTSISGLVLGLGERYPSPVAKVMIEDGGAAEFQAAVDRVVAATSSVKVTEVDGKIEIEADEGTDLDLLIKSFMGARLAEAVERLRSLVSAIEGGEKPVEEAKALLSLLMAIASARAYPGYPRADHGGYPSAYPSARAKRGAPMNAKRLEQLKGAIDLFLQGLKEMKGGSTSTAKFEKAANVFAKIAGECDVEKRRQEKEHRPEDAPNAGAGEQPDLSAISDAVEAFKEFPELVKVFKVSNEELIKTFSKNIQLILNDLKKDLGEIKLKLADQPVKKRATSVQLDDEDIAPSGTEEEPDVVDWPMDMAKRKS